MTAAIITIGNELLEGRVQDTNSTKISRILSGAGISVCRRVTVGDSAEAIGSALRQCAAEADAILVTGGLGPTEDDRTVEAASLALGVPLVKDAGVEKRIRSFYSNLGLDFHESSLKQAMVLEGARVLANPTGTAPGMALKLGGRLFTFFPGVPRELDAMLPEAMEVIAAGAKGAIAKLSLKTFGTGETQLETLIPAELVKSTNPVLSFLPGNFEVELRLTALADTPADAQNLIDKAKKTLCESVGEYIYGEDDDTLEGTVIRLLAERGLTLGCAESCSGGLLTSRLVSVPGSSKVLRGSIIAYTTGVKEKVLGISPATLAKHGTVSEKTAAEMAEQAIKRLGTDVGLSITGNAGPTAGDPSEEIGRVYAAVALRGKKPAVATRKILRPRNDVRYIATQIALDLLRRNLLPDEEDR
ncbi:MAG: competence/damage-inducible protein A [bacterium]